MPARTESWECGWPLQTRVRAFAVLAGLNVPAMFVSIFVFGGSAGTAVFLVFFGTGMLAFLLGTYFSLTLSRNARGKVRLTKTWRVAFYTLQPETIHWSEYEAIGAIKLYALHFEDWFVFFVLLAYGVVPGLLWWWFMLRPENFEVYLYKNHGFPETCIFRTQQELLAQRVAETVSEVTAVPMVKTSEST